MKLRYFPCRKGGDHDGEVLNYICLQQKCKSKGLICSMCKLNHKEHTTMPLKMLLQSLKEHKQKPMENEGFENHLQQLEEYRNMSLYQLRICVESVAEQFKKIQEEICEDFNKIKVELLEKVELNMKFHEIIESALKNQRTDQQSFMNDFTHIASMVKKHDKSDKVQYSLNLEDITSKYENQQKHIRKIFHNTSKIVEKQLFGNVSKPELINKYESSSSVEEEEDVFHIGDIFDDGFDTVLDAKLPKSKEVMPNNYSFSSSFKGNTITLTNSNMRARQTSSAPSRFVFVDQGIGLKNQKIAFKITNLTNWIGFGIGLRTNLSKIQYAFNYNSTKHGSYMLSSNSFKWSHSNTADNIQNTGFAFQKNDIIEVTVQPYQLLFKNRKTSKTYKLKINFDESEWKQACFCANLCSEGDEVEIV